jgi:hypothetical protein
MNQRNKWLVIFTALIMLIAVGTPVMADDDDEDEHDEKHEYYQKDHDDEDEDDDEDDGYYDESDGLQESQVPISSQTEYWNIWSREARNNPAQALPLTTPSEVPLILNNIETSVYVIPQDGQLLVSSEAFVKALGGKAKYYPQSKICVLTTENMELIVRAGSNAAYENRVKTPMPIPAAAYENSVYVPISVAANALGYRASWDEEKASLILQAY